MKKLYLRLIKLAIVTSLSSICVEEWTKFYENYTRKPTINLSLENEKNIEVEGLDIKPYNFEMVKNFQKDKMIKELEIVVEKYASIFCLDKNSVLEIIKFNTNDFNSDNFVWNKNISKTSEIYDDFTSQVFFLTYDIYKYPGNYSDFEVKRCYDIEPQIGDMTIREFVYETADILGVDGDMALAIACLESGYFRCTYNNDSFGTGHSHNNIYQGIIYGISNLKYNYINCGLTTPESIAVKYCPPSVDVWPGKVRSIEYNLKNGYRLYDESNKELVYRR